jgi:hypothetical protein
MKQPKPKHCSNCGSQFNPYKSTDKLCSFQCSVAHKEKQEIEERFKKIEAKVKERDSVKLLTKVAKQLAQKWARIRDKDLPCISCGAVTSTMWDGGHLYKSELYSGLRFDEMNINKQCRKCNTYLNGNEINYVRGYIDRYGLAAFNEISKRAKERKNTKWSVPELKQIINYYKLKIKDNE